tara:strand:+ start:2121 stop:2471 length:351 start_codon:yes stop_codon:yes gene_type:complete
MIFDTLFISSATTLILLIWFGSDAFIEYAKLIGGAKFFGVKEFEKLQETRATLTYHDYLSEYKSNFFTKLITCPTCLSVWTTLIVTLAYADSLYLFPLCNIISLVAYKLTSNLLES